jgi:putative ABC transport system ATP-binding protein
MSQAQLSAEPEPIIHLTGLCRDFQVGDQVVHALKNIDLSFSPGEYASIMGPSGSGKSTLLNMLGLLDQPTAGEYRLAGKDTASMTDDERAAARQSEIGFIFQSFHLVSRLSAFENVELPLTLAGIAPDQRRARVQAALEAVELDTRTDHRPDQLSGGQRQRVAIARAIVTQPSVLLADEPTGNLDSRSGAEVIDIMEDLNKQGITLFVVTHDPDIGGRARRKIVLVDGKVSTDQIRQSG